MEYTKLLVNVPNSKMFYIDEYIEQEGGVGNVYLSNVRFKDKTNIDPALLLKQIMFGNIISGFRQNNNQSIILIFVDDDGLVSPSGVQIYW